MAQHVLRQVLDVFGIDLVAVAHEQRPHLGEAAPDDDRARRGAEVDAGFDQLRRRVPKPVGVRVIGTRVDDQPLDVVAEPLVQEHVLGDRRAQLDDALLVHQRCRGEPA